MYYIAICEIFNPRIHGKDENSSIGIENHFLVSETFELEEFYDNSYQDTITSLKYDYKRVAKNNLKSLKEPHCICRRITRQ